MRKSVQIKVQGSAVHDKFSNVLRVVGLDLRLISQVTHDPFVLVLVVALQRRSQ
ncbi:hypothetical protein XACS582_14390002 [Xanthomonas citri pv. citri]|uniref:Uncharacterized protein n=1 Tax=Xanthomonas citri pv. citri TaxID=611301 RepID=A0A0U5F999_XANCI|nr:hypothetical protein XAC908_1310004 [Xanthomonas citri pv. citri]CEE29696.1 hypothetical protein XAC3824_640002 [Xanthomonas citri pv. citri]CEE52351.1 hypothetical protein XAC71A_1490006 [Xanthomonas citri pv. citri]CEE58865.1 hypothetical protein XACS584_1960003 [Xanthomonas citri pv. citri]CEE61794.1 hypothetical protein XAC3608_1960003 [Xanthomonas citri pv. citri]